MTHKLALLLVDGLRADTARDYLGYVQALNEAGRAHWATLRCELLSVSRPLYATVINGRTPLDHGILGNGQAGQCCGSTVFDDLAAAGRCSAVAAYHWFYELLAGTVFDPLAHRDAALPTLAIDGARWYWEDDYPDSHLLADAEALRQVHAPDFLLVHPMGMDLAGHRHGGESAGYTGAARRLDHLLAQVLPRWHAAGYDVLLTSDHGMHADHWHGGPLAVERDVPLIWLPRTGGGAPAPAHWPTTQLGIRHFIARHLGCP